MCVLLIAVVATAALCIGWGKRERPTDEVIRIAAVGGGFVLDASGRDTGDLLKIAAVCKSGGGTLYLKNCAGLATIDLMKIAAVGQGQVVIEF